ncbi:MAG: DNA alkylation repair protein [Nanoarchaeota archaeon]|nr:DNA alkylation repair protein [Nanoarchaeota archaeon]
MKIVKEIEKELKKRTKHVDTSGQVKYFKESIKPYGLGNPESRKMARKYYAKYKPSYLEAIKISEELLKSGYFEEGVIAFDLMTKYKKQFDKNSFDIFESWVDKYIHNWAWCDDLGPHLINVVIEKYPELVEELVNWTSSKNRWKKRAAAVSLIPSAYRGKFLKESFIICDKLLTDEDDLVQKGYGWLLKVASQFDEKRVISYLEKHYKKMPRTAFRYALEKINEKDKKRLMKL